MDLSFWRDDRGYRYYMAGFTPEQINGTEEYIQYHGVHWYLTKLDKGYQIIYT